MQARMPSLFISHGAPSLILDECPTRDWFRQAAREWPRPKAIVCVSANWCTTSPEVSGSVEPETIHDFYGFPSPLYRIGYPVAGSPELAIGVARRLKAAGLDCLVEGARGLDHGAWVPLKLMYPDAETPVLQLSVQPQLTPEHHLAMGHALSPLRDEGVLIIGSGGATHNLGAFRGQSWDTPPYDYVETFDRWLVSHVCAGRIEDLFNYREAPEGQRNHPTPEHLLPLFVALGAAMDTMEERPKGRLVHHEFTYGILSMSAFRWD